jgi:hypothetical protein
MNDTAVQPPVAEEAVTAGTLLRRARTKTASESWS